MARKQPPVVSVDTPIGRDVDLDREVVRDRRGRRIDEEYARRFEQFEPDDAAMQVTPLGELYEAAHRRQLTAEEKLVIVVELVVGKGWPQRRVAKVMGLTEARISQIMREHREQAAIGAALGRAPRSSDFGRGERLGTKEFKPRAVTDTDADPAAGLRKAWVGTQARIPRQLRKLAKDLADYPLDRATAALGEPQARVYRQQMEDLAAELLGERDDDPV